MLDQLEHLIHLQAGRHQKVFARARIVRGRFVRVSGEPFHCDSDCEIDGPVPERSWNVVPGADAMVVLTEPG